MTLVGAPGPLTSLRQEAGLSRGLFLAVGLISVALLVLGACALLMWNEERPVAPVGFEVAPVCRNLREKPSCAYSRRDRSLARERLANRSYMRCSTSCKST